MNYLQTLDWLYSQLPMYQRIGKAAYKADLGNTIELCKRLSNPQRDFKSAHIAGTNGKGSVAHMVASVCQEAGLRTGLHTSPHLKDFRERIRVNEEMISEKEVVAFVNKHKALLNDLNPSFFEWQVALAFHHFRERHVDVAIVETGLGGRLDSTNILEPLVSVITNIGHDHQQFLGDTLEKVAQEKAGIIKPKTPVVIGESDPRIQHVFESMAKQQQATIQFADQLEHHHFSTDLKGSYQQKNQRTALATLQVLGNYFDLPELAFERGFKQVVRNTGFIGRWQILQENPLTICDCGHNQEGIREALSNIEQLHPEHIHMVWGMVEDKAIGEILGLLPKEASYYFCKPKVPRGLEADELLRVAESLGLHGDKHDTVNSALEAASQAAKEGEIIFIGGSTFVVAEVV